MTAPRPGDRPRLTREQIQILVLLAAGGTPADIAERMCLCEKATRSRLRHLYKLLDVRTAAAAVHQAHCGGWLHKYSLTKTKGRGRVGAS